MRFDAWRKSHSSDLASSKLAEAQTAKTSHQSGMQFIAFAGERALNYSTLFAEILIAHLQGCGVLLQDWRFQTDNGSEFIDAWNAAEDSAFTKAVEAVKGLVHQTIPSVRIPGRPMSKPFTVSSKMSSIALRGFIHVRIFWPGLWSLSCVVQRSAPEQFQRP
ncbi:MAG: hypothetical protein ONB46_07130 [candidate division KSB1 bacterium]|nr:hypothetical protein [candidate division KSB1 bacterium]MDZ7368291.1 hypothetical protein [candidate division KSB1 bacterium]MDZ7406129.1 hypothetical protein [candidate division KSB1 bacterium]